MAEHEGFDAHQAAASAEPSSAHALIAEHALGSHLIIRPTINLFPLSNYSFGYRMRILKPSPSYNLSFALESCHI
jgi:hypothetical protein